VFAFQSNLAKIELKFAASTDEDVRKLFLTYDLDILPILMRFDSHAEKEFPLDQVDLAATAEWIDDRIVSFVQTYLALHQNQLYLKDVMVSDPIAGVRFPKFAAATTLVHKGTTHYFIGEETLQAFREREGLSGS
jgi:YHS domain-containing protein